MNFLFYQNQCAKLNVRERHLEGFTRLMGLAPRCSDSGQDLHFNHFPDTDAAGGVQGPHFMKHRCNECAKYLGAVPGQGVHIGCQMDGASQD